jgi:hypothetical protein
MRFYRLGEHSFEGGVIVTVIPINYEKGKLSARPWVGGGGRPEVTRRKVLHREVELTGENRLLTWSPGKSRDQRKPSHCLVGNEYFPQGRCIKNSKVRAQQKRWDGVKCIVVL